MIIGYGNRGMSDPYLLFKKKEEIDKFIAHETTPVARFNACDYVDFSKEESINSSGIARKNLEKLTIKTNAKFDFDANDWLYDLKNKVIWKITGITVLDDNQMKHYSLRPRKFTILQLSRR